MLSLTLKIVIAIIAATLVVIYAVPLFLDLVKYPANAYRHSRLNNNHAKIENYTPDPGSNFVNDFFKGQVYVINLASRTDRMENTHATLARKGIMYTRIDAIDKSQLPLTTRGTLRDSEVACYLSHCKAYEAFLASNRSSWCLIFEDDIYIPSNVDQSTFYETMKSVLKLDKNAEIIQFGTCGNSPLLQHCDLCVYKGTRMCAHAYAIRGSCAAKILKTRDRIPGAIDNFRKFNTFVVYGRKSKEDKRATRGHGIVYQVNNLGSDIAFVSNYLRFDK